MTYTYILREVVRDMHDVQTKKQQGFSALTGALMAVAIQAITSLAAHNGNLKGVVHDLSSDG